MYKLKSQEFKDKRELYDFLAGQVEHLLADERNIIANCANFAALLYQSIPEVNWLGFYFLKDTQLVVGPFQGNPACVRIELGKGVCGTAAVKRETVIVSDVHAFPGHIACDARSNSEIVLPLIKEKILIGVLDIDSPIRNRFDRDDQAGLERLVGVLTTKTDF